MKEQNKLTQEVIDEQRADIIINRYKVSCLPLYTQMLHVFTELSDIPIVIL